MTLATSLRRVADPRTIESGLVSSAAVGALALVDPARLSPVRRWAYRLAVAAVASASVALEVAADESFVPAHPWAKVALPVATSGLMLGFAHQSEAWDQKVSGWLRRTGVPRPRLAIAAGTFAFSFGSQLLGRTLETVRFPLAGEPPELQPVPAEVRDLVLGMLAATTQYDADVLRTQLDTARVNVWPGESGFSSLVDFAVGDDVRLAVPHRFTFPVKAHFTNRRGQPVQASLLVEEGLLDALVLDDAPDSTGLWIDGSLAVDQVDHWPAVADVMFVLDTPER